MKTLDRQENINFQIISNQVSWGEVRDVITTGIWYKAKRQIAYKSASIIYTVIYYQVLGEIATYGIK